MIAGETLAAWFSDAAARERTVRRLEEARAGLRAIASFATLEEAVAGARTGDAPRLLAAARAFINAGGVDECLELLIGAAQEDPFFRPPMRSALGEVQAGLLLFDRPLLSIYVALADPAAIAEKRMNRSGNASIVFTGRHSLYCFVRARGAQISIWEAPPIGDDFSAGASGRCRRVERRALRDGEFLELDGSRQGFVVDHAEGEMIYIQASTPTGAAPLAVEYDSDTLEFAGASSSDEVGSRIQLMLSLLRTMDRKDAAPLFAERLASAHFYDRWYAMREFLALDADQALPHLRAMAAGDPHPEVREAAGEALRALDVPEEAEELEEADACHS
jgi:hypothetical protein